MKVAFITRTGPPDVIEVGSLPDPVPFVVGCDLAGEVVAVGSDVQSLRPGMRVWGSNQGLLGRQGTFAELAAIDERWLYPTPDSLSDRDAAAAALVSITAHLGLVTHAKLEAGEMLFVNGASGGVGSAAVRVARALGARAIGTAGTEEKRARVRSLGADEVFDYRADDLVEVARAATPNGIDVYWETQREPMFDRAVGLLAAGWRRGDCGFQSPACCRSTRRLWPTRFRKRRP